MATARATAGAPARATTARWIATRSRATRATRGTRGRARATPNDGEAHAAYLRDVAATRAPAELAALARVLDALGCETIAPNARRGMNNTLSLSDAAETLVDFGGAILLIPKY